MQRLAYVTDELGAGRGQHSLMTVPFEEKKRGLTWS